MANYALETKGVKAQILPAERFLLRARVRPSASAVEEAARMLVESKRPMLVAGDEVWKGAAQAELLDFSEKFGLPVTFSGGAFRSFPVKHPHYLGGYDPQSDYVKRGVDLAIVIGAPDFGGRAMATTPIRSIEPSGARIVRMGIDTAAMGRSRIVADPESPDFIRGRAIGRSTRANFCHARQSGRRIAAEPRQAPHPSR